MQDEVVLDPDHSQKLLVGLRDWKPVMHPLEGICVGDARLLVRLRGAIGSVEQVRALGSECETSKADLELGSERSVQSHQKRRTSISLDLVVRCPELLPGRGWGGFKMDKYPNIRCVKGDWKVGSGIGTHLLYEPRIPACQVLVAEQCYDFRVRNVLADGRACPRVQGVYVKHAQ